MPEVMPEPMPEPMPESMPEPLPERLPKQSRDTHPHIFGDAAAYPVANANANANALYQPPQAWSLAMVKALHDATGVERAVFVQPTICGTDHRLLYDVLKNAPFTCFAASLDPNHSC
jgi:predicted TIM-barrel fold metal-dependent hydrolase